MCVHSCTSTETVVLERIAGFDWDDGNWPKCGKHGVSRDEIEAALTQPLTVFDDLAHGTAELRYKAITRTTSDRFVFVSFTLRVYDGKTYLRPISARYMHRKEIRTYVEEDTSGLAQ